MKPILELRNVTKRIGGKTLVDSITFTVPPGEVFGFLGPNGAGKTTTIRMLVGLMSITEGEILIDGHSVARDFEAAIRQVGAIVENPELYKYLSGYDNLLHYARMTPGVTKERIDEVVELVGLKNRIHEKVKRYSLGMRQRLGVAQALLHRPKLLVLDEPTNGLDPAGIRELRDHLRRLAREEGISVFVSSHLLSEMELMCDRVAIIQLGKLVTVRPIGEYAADEGDVVTLTVEVGAGEEEKALQTLTAAGFQAIASESRIEARLTKARIPEANLALVQAGISVYALRPSAKTLEDKFLEMTGAEQIG